MPLWYIGAKHKRWWFLNTRRFDDEEVLAPCPTDRRRGDHVHFRKRDGGREGRRDRDPPDRDAERTSRGERQRRGDRPGSECGNPRSPQHRSVGGPDQHPCRGGQLLRQELRCRQQLGKDPGERARLLHG